MKSQRSALLGSTVVCWLCFVGGSMALILNAGCGSGRSAATAIGAVNESNLQRLSNLYERFQVTHQWRGPKNEAELKEFINGLDEKTLSRMSVSLAEVDALFTSERDNQPFNIKYGQQGASRGESKPVIFEQTGLNGKRLVGFTGMKWEEVETAEYDKLLAGKS